MMATDPIEPPERLPHNIEAEAALLGALMIENRLVDMAADKGLIAAHFFEPLHGRIYSAIQHERNNNRNANPVTLKPYFDSDEAMKEVGGPAYMAQLTGSGAAVIGAKDFTDQIIELARLRALVGIGRAIAERAGDTSMEISFAEVVAFAESEIADASQESLDGTSELSAGECADRAIKAGENAQRRGVLSGIPCVDEALGPIRRKQMVILGGRPGMGKSALASSMAIGAASRSLQLYQAGEVDRPSGILFISLEMSDEELGARMLSDATFQYDGRAVPYGLIESGQLNREQMRRVMEARDWLGTLPLQVIDIGQSTTGRINALVRRWKRRFAANGIRLELVIVDYLQKLRPDHKARDLYEKITEVSQDLKTLAKSQNVGVLALAQLSRGVEQRADHRPIMSDLRDSGQIEQDADGVIFVYRQEYYLEAAEPALGDSGRDKWEAALEACRHKIEIICAKRRQGKTGKRVGEFHGAFAAVRG